MSHNGQRFILLSGTSNNVTQRPKLYRQKHIILNKQLYYKSSRNISSNIACYMSNALLLFKIFGVVQNLEDGYVSEDKDGVRS